MGASKTKEMKKTKDPVKDEEDSVNSNSKNGHGHGHHQGTNPVLDQAILDLLADDYGSEGKEDEILTRPLNEAEGEYGKDVMKNSDEEGHHVKKNSEDQPKSGGED
ncbi:hypothetical protein PTKIN_Ptkin19aG0009300 [Pterospermum kingtungense]